MECPKIDHCIKSTTCNDCSRYGYLYWIHVKSQSLNIFKSVKADVELQLGKKIKAVKFNRGGEYYDRHDRSGEQRLRSFALFSQRVGNCSTIHHVKQI
ncbi:hypothetical protein CR513_02469, partial [Mucuna pruriens]